MIKIQKQQIRIPPGTYVSLHLPKDAKIIDVGIKDTTPTIWYEFPYEEGEDVPYEPREFVLRTTGCGFHREEGGIEQHLGTCSAAEGRLVYHIYEVL